MSWNTGGNQDKRGREWAIYFTEQNYQAGRLTPEQEKIWLERKKGE